MKYSKSMMAIAASTCMLFACHSNSDYKTDSDSTSKESAIAQQSNVDTAAMNNGGSTAPAMPADTSMAMKDTMQHSAPVAATPKMGSAKPNMAKKGHKGSIRMAVYRPSAGKMEVDKNGVYNYAEVLPMFPGGEPALEKFVQNHIEYPQDAVDNGVEGTVRVTFAVDEAGKVYAPEVQGEKMGYGLDDEAMKVVDQMPKWTPGRIKGKNVKTYYTLPITYTLQ